MSTTSRAITGSVAGAGAEGDDNGAERFDACEAPMPAGLMAVPALTATTEAVGVRRGTRWCCCASSTRAPPQTLESGETRVYGVGASNATAMIRIRANGDVEITPKAGQAVRIGGGTLSAALNGVVVASGVDSFTGATYGASGTRAPSCSQEDLNHGDERQRAR